MTEAINIIFQGNVDSPDMVFVEIENDNGESIRVGEWDEIPELQQHNLRIEIPSHASAIRADRERLIEATETTKPHLEAWYSKAELRDIIWNTPIGDEKE